MKDTMTVFDVDPAVVRPAVDALMAALDAHLHPLSATRGGVSAAEILVIGYNFLGNLVRTLEAAYAEVEGEPPGPQFRQVVMTSLDRYFRQSTYPDGSLPTDEPDPTLAAVIASVMDEILDGGRVKRH